MNEAITPTTEELSKTEELKEEEEFPNKKEETTKTFTSNTTEVSPHILHTVKSNYQLALTSNQQHFFEQNFGPAPHTSSPEQILRTYEKIQEFIRTSIKKAIATPQPTSQLARSNQSNAPSKKTFT